MRLITLLAGYAAGLAVAMKYRKTAGASKLPEDVTATTLDNFIDEVVDIHKDAFSDAKKLFDKHFSDVHDMDSLKAKVDTLIGAFMTEVDTKIANITAEWVEKKTQAETLLQNAYDEKLALLEQAKSKALEFAGVALDVVEPWIGEARKKLDANYKKAKTKANKIS